MPIDPPTYGKYQATELLATVNGRALVEMLDEQRLLLTPERERQIRVDILRKLVKRLGQKDPHQLLRLVYGRDVGTTHEMFHATKEWLDWFLNAVIDGTLEE
jgi:hypothetical protein